MIVEVVNGWIIRIDPAKNRYDVLSDPSAHIEQLENNTYLLPGLIDCHLHAPQWPQIGVGLDLPLERWLFEYTFPLESRFSNIEFAQTVWDDMVPRLLREGTTTAVYYSSIDLNATIELAKTCIRHGQRAFVGRVAMDLRDGCPDYYRDLSAADGIELSRESISLIRELDDGKDLVFPIVTPRFTPACTNELLTGLGTLAQETSTRVQTHCSESIWEHQYALKRFGISDTIALKNFGLLTPHSVLAHGNHTNEHDWDTIQSFQAGIAHCPLSNIYFANNIFPTKQALEHGVYLGLGTDIAGGYNPSILAQCRSALDSSSNLQNVHDASTESRESRLTVTNALWLATNGAAQMLNIPVGHLSSGKRFDAIAVQDPLSDSQSNNREGESDSHFILERIVRLGNSRHIQEVWVSGRKVASQRMKIATQYEREH